MSRADYIAKAFERGGPRARRRRRHLVPDLRASRTAPTAQPVAPAQRRRRAARDRRRRWAGQSVVLGAHYDHLGRGWPDVRAGPRGQDPHRRRRQRVGRRGAARGGPPARRRSSSRERSIVFVAFTGEEWGLKGSRHYVRHMRALAGRRQALAMVNLDTVGRLGDQQAARCSAAARASEWLHIAMGVGFTTGVESNCVADDPRRQRPGRLPRGRRARRSSSSPARTRTTTAPATTSRRSTPTAWCRSPPSCARRSST